MNNNMWEKYPNIEEKYWTTKEIFKYFNIQNNAEITNSYQYLGGVFILKKNKHSKQFINLFLKVLHDHMDLFTDKYNNYQDSIFIDNRHDQSISSLIRKQIGSIVVDCSDLKNFIQLHYSTN